MAARPGPWMAREEGDNDPAGSARVPGHAWGVAYRASHAARRLVVVVSGAEGPAPRAEAGASGGAEALRAVLAEVGDGIGCEHWTLPDHGLPALLLKDLGV